MHGANASQNAWQLILPNVCEPLSDGILNDFVNTEEAEKKKVEQNRLITQ